MAPKNVVLLKKKFFIDYSNEQRGNFHDKIFIILLNTNYNLFLSENNTWNCFK